MISTNTLYLYCCFSTFCLWLCVTFKQVHAILGTKRFEMSPSCTDLINVVIFVEKLCILSHFSFHCYCHLCITFTSSLISYLSSTRAKKRTVIVNFIACPTVLRGTWIDLAAIYVLYADKKVPNQPRPNKLSISTDNQNFSSPPSTSYQILCPKALVGISDAKKAAGIILDSTGLADDAFRLGNTKAWTFIFFLFHLTTAYIFAAAQNIDCARCESSASIVHRFYLRYCCFCELDLHF